MHELTDTQWASGPMNAPNSASKALPCGPWVRTCPSRTSSTALRSSSVIQGRANGTWRTSLIVNLDGFTDGQGLIGGDAGRDDVEFVFGRGARIGAGANAGDELGNEHALRQRQRREIEGRRRRGRVTVPVQA